MAEPTPVLVAPDDFKGTLTAGEVAAAIARGLRAGGLDADELPVADGGDGTVDVLLSAFGGERIGATVADPLGRPVDAELALLEGGRTAVVEMAQASGLWRVSEDERDAAAATSRGTGELIAVAAAAGAAKVLVAVGGSATTDGGEGALAALREAGAAVAPGVAGTSPELIVLCDVHTAWEECARVFGPQKGADPETVERLEQRLTSLADAAPHDPRSLPMTGCAGGLSGGLWAHLGARLVPGAGYVLDAIGFDERMRGARFVITGEGTLDEQTLEGKAAGEVATRCRQSGVGCHAVVGRNELDAFGARILDLASVTEASTPAELERAGRDLALAATGDD